MSVVSVLDTLHGDVVVDVVGVGYLGVGFVFGSDVAF